MRDEGWIAEFATERAFVEAVQLLHDEGFRSLEVFTPYPVESVLHLLEPRPRDLTRIAGVCAVVGLASGYVIQWYLNAVEYPLDVGGRPPHSLPAFIPITFEMGVLFTAFATVIGVLVLSGLPRLWRPVFEVDGIERATVDRFFVLVHSDDAMFDWATTRARLLRLEPERVLESGRWLA